MQTNSPRIPTPATLVLAALACLAAAVPASAADVSGTATREEFVAFHERFSGAAHLFPRHGAKPLGWTGFELWADVAADVSFDDDELAAAALDDDLPADTLAFGRVGARKGLPGGFDLGIAYGRMLDGDVELLSGELGWALVRGGAVLPALGLRASATRSEGSAYELDQYGLEAVLSKGFAVVTPFVSAGVVRSEGSLGRDPAGVLPGEPETFEAETTRAVFSAGLSVRLLLPKLTFSLEKAEEVTGAVRIVIGF